VLSGGGGKKIRGMAVSLSHSCTRTTQEALNREVEEVLALWEEAGSKGLDTWLDLPAAYTTPEDSGGELKRGYDYSPMVEECLTTLEDEKEHDGYSTWLKRLFG
jgi:hypothetical protein